MNTSYIVVLGQAAPEQPTTAAPGGVVPKPPPGTNVAGGVASASVSMLLLLALAAWICVKQKGAQWPHIGLGILIGVVGAGTIVGQVSWNVIGIITQLLSGLGASFG
jgi:hypothetical protein